MLTLSQTPAKPLTTLDDRTRDELAEAMRGDGYAVLPGRLPEDLRLAAIDAIDRIAAEDRAADPNLKSIKRQNCVVLDPAFRALMMYTPAVQMAYDAFGPLFQLNQSNLTSRMAEPDAPEDFVAATGWHADGPHGGFPKVANEHGHAVGLHYLKFGYFLTDLTHGNGGSLQVVRGSHLRPQRDGASMGEFDIGRYDDDLVQIDCPAGSVVAFHQAQWHAAPANQSEHERKNLYISYCPLWMRPYDYDLGEQGQPPNGLTGLTDEESFLLGEYRPARRFWQPTPDDYQRLGRFARAHN